MRAAVILAALALASCATAPAFDPDDLEARAAHADALAEWCAAVGPCVSGRGGLQPAPGAPALPVYSEACGYLPPLLGDDC